jgi:MSHA pilin protein MshC
MSTSSGFTTIELVVTLLIVGIISVVAIPRMTIDSTFDNRTFHDEVRAALKYAQKRALASRRNVCVTFTANSLTLATATAEGADAACNQGLPGPDGMVPYTVNAKPNTSFEVTVPAMAPPGFSFDAQGSPSGGTQVLKVKDLPFTITVNQVTGYVQ